MPHVPSLVSPRPLCRPLLSVLAVASLFFLFFPFIRTCQLRRRLLRLHLASPSHRRYPLGVTSTPQLPHQPRGRYNRRHFHPLRGAKHPLDSPSHASRAHTSHPAAVALTVPSAP